MRLANNILALAIKKGASDIHIEPQEKGVVLRLRIDGVLYVENVLSKKIQLPLASRFKILSRLDISERRMPQDGRISIKIEDRAIDFRVSTVPAKFGEKIVMRILDKSGSLLPLDKIIVHTPTVEKLRWMITQPYGIIYVTGPTGSGKTTTLYSSLNEINSPEVNISTAEDPIEYDLAGLCQVQTHKDIGLDFARILRAFLRQDPDVILVGETRDPETAKISVEAALTGHLVFTTLHTNDAPSSFTRLEEMGIEPFLMANSTIGIIAQRLARRLCQNCKVQTEVDEVTLGYFGYTKENSPPFFRGEGCEQCNHTGKKGRVGIYEILTMNDDLKRAVARGARTDEVRTLAIQEGMLTLKEYAMVLMAEGLTSVDEVLTEPGRVKLVAAAVWDGLGPQLQKLIRRRSRCFFKKLNVIPDVFTAADDQRHFLVERGRLDIQNPLCPGSCGTPSLFDDHRQRRRFVKQPQLAFRSGIQKDPAF